MVGLVLETLLDNLFECSEADFRRIAHAAAGAGFRSVSVFSSHDQAIGIKQVRAILDDAGLTADMAELAPRFHEGPAAARENLEAGLDLFGELGASMMLCCHEPKPSIDVARATEGLAAVCESAAKRGIRVILEGIPSFAPADLATAWDIVRGTGAANAGVDIDIMHWQYQQGGPDFDLLRSIPGDKVHYVQLCDAAFTTFPSDQDYFHVATAERPLPGDGVTDIPAVLKALKDIGADPWFAMEVYNSKLSALGADAMAKRLFEVGNTLFAHA